MRRLSALCLLIALAACAVPAPAPQAAVPQGMDYPVYFSPWSAALDDTAQSALQHATDAAKAALRGPIDVTGYADPTGSAQANVLLSQLRAQVVADQLIADGVEPARITRHARGATDFTLSAVESRRVTVSVGR